MERLPISDVAMLRQLWADRTISTCDVARRFGVSTNYLYAVARRHGLPKRMLPPGGVPVQKSDDDEPTEDTPGGDSLAFSPWVESRIKELEQRFAAARMTQWDE